MESNNIPDVVGESVSDIFTWLQNEKNSLYKDPTDYHADGTPLSLSEWADKNKICYEFICWNTAQMTHEPVLTYKAVACTNNIHRAVCKNSFCNQ